MNSELWFVGQYIEAELRFDVQGIFSTKEKAVAACRDRNYFIMPLTLDENFPHETFIVEETEYPLA